MIQRISLLLLLITTACSTTRPFQTADGRKLPNSIAETRRIPINGTKQFVTIRGADRRKPVLLWLHGGPGSLAMPLYMHYNAPLEQHFTVVYWDQRGSGKSYSSRIPASSMTLEQFVADAHALTNWLKKRFRKDRILLVGHSWGGLLGMHVIANHPTSYHAFVAVSPVTNGPESERLSYQLTLDTARHRRDTAAVALLETMGPPVDGAYKGGLGALRQQRALVQKYGGAFHQDIRATSSRIFARSKEYSILDYLKINKIIRLSYPLATSVWPTMNLQRQIPIVEVPVYFCLGRYDTNCPSTLVAEYYKSLRAPTKELIWFDQSAHAPCLEEASEFNALLTKTVLPTIKESK